MAGGSEGRSLEETPTWAVAVVCFVLVAVSIVIEYIIHLIGKVCTISTFIFPIFICILNTFSGEDLIHLTT